MGGDLGRKWGDGFPTDLRWGMAHAYVPPIFQELLLLDFRQSTR